VTNEIKVFHHQSPNFGDYIAIEIAERLSNKKVISINEYSNDMNEDHYIITGSILTLVNKYSIVWGGGIANYKDEIPKAKEFRAVRGKLTLKKVQQLGFDCNICGDPVMLMSDLYNKPNVDKKYELGIIPHWVDYYSAMLAYRDCSDVLIIDILRKPELILNDLLQCNKTISSSLHGIIISIAYDIPSMWIEFSDKVIGDGYKFHDFFTSVNIPLYKPFNLREKKSIQEIISQIITYEIKFDKKEFFSSCPFLSDELSNKYKVQ